MTSSSHWQGLLQSGGQPFSMARCLVQRGFPQQPSAETLPSKVSVPPEIPGHHQDHLQHLSLHGSQSQSKKHPICFAFLTWTHVKGLELPRQAPRKRPFLESIKIYKLVEEASKLGEVLVVIY